MIRAIYRDFLAAWARDPSWQGLRAGYVRPHLDLLETYVRDWGPGWGDVPADDAYRREWGEQPERAEALVRGLAGVDPVPLLAEGLHRGAALLRPGRPVEAVALVGLGTSNACAFWLHDRPVVAVAVEAWVDAGPDPDWPALVGRSWAPWVDLPLWVAHELAHAVRYGEADDALSRCLREGRAYPEAVDRVPLRNFLVDEGLAVAAAARACPEAGPERWLWFRREDLDFYRAHEPRLWRELGPLLDRPPGREGWVRFFSAGAQGDLPPRSGYYLGWRLVEVYLERHPGLTLAEAARLPAEAFAFPGR